MRGPLLASASVRSIFGLRPIARRIEASQGMSARESVAMVLARALRRFGQQRRGLLGANVRRCAWRGFGVTLRGCARRCLRQVHFLRCKSVVVQPTCALTTRSTGPAGTGLLLGERRWRRAG